MVMGDLNAKVGKDNTQWENITGKHGIGEVKSGGESHRFFVLQMSCA